MPLVGVYSRDVADGILKTLAQQERGDSLQPCFIPCFNGNVFNLPEFMFNVGSEELGDIFAFPKVMPWTQGLGQVR